MAGEFRKIPIKQFPKHIQKKDTAEQKYWKSFEFPTVVKEYTAINHVDFCRVKPYNCAVTCSGKIQIFAPYSNEVKRTYTRNKENIYGAKYRSDGKLLVAGGESGVVQILDVSSRAILRNFQGHTKPTHVCCFGKESSQIFTASDDKTLRCWDLPSQKETITIKAHKDYIRCGCVNETNTNHFITGSYDHMVKVWDCRSSTVAMEMNHGAPVECILMHQNGSICLSAGSNYIKVWDMLAGGKLFSHFSNHQKTITTIQFDNECKRLFSGSLDRHVKIYNVNDYSVIANIDYPSPILAMDISKDDNHLTVGMSDGAISLRHRSKSTGAEPQKKRTRQLQPGSYLYRIRNQGCKPDADNLVITEDRYPKDSPTDKYLRSYQYHEALDSVLGKNQCPPKYVISVILELSRRDALEIALSNRDPASLVPIIRFLTKNITNPSYGKILIPVADLLLDMYTSLIGQDFTFDLMLSKLRNRIADDLRNQEDMIQLAGAIEQIFSMAAVAPVDIDNMGLSDIAPCIDGEKLPDISERNDINENNENIEKIDKFEDTSILVNGHGTDANGHDVNATDEIDFVIGSNMME